MRGMLHGERPSGDQYYQADEVRNDPPPVQERLPILVGGGGEKRTLRTVARYADACNVGGGFESVKRKDEILRRHCEEVGRDESEIERTVGAGTCIIRDDPAEARRVFEAMFARNGNAEQWKDQPVGTVDQIVERLRPFLGIGFRHFIFGFPSPYDAESQERLISEVKPALERLMKVTLLAGGTGGTKLAHGFALVGDRVELTVIANVGDDMELHGLHISPDIDALLYTLGGLIDAERGWGVRGDTFTAHAMLERYGAPAWFTLGDADLATHVERTRRLRDGERLTDAVAAMATALGIRARILPATDDRYRTRLETDEGPSTSRTTSCVSARSPTVRGVISRASRRAADRRGARRHPRRRADRHRPLQPDRQHRPDPGADGHA